MKFLSQVKEESLKFFICFERGDHATKRILNNLVQNDRNSEDAAIYFCTT